MTRGIAGLSWKGYEGRDYEGFWVGPAKQHLDQLERAIVAHALPGGRSVVEIGAGFGRLGPCYIGKYGAVHMVEPASNLRAAAASTFGNAVQYHDATAERLPFAAESIDAVLMVRVFHHLEHPDAVLREIHRVLVHGGRLVFNFSNIRNAGRVVRFALGRGQNPFAHDVEQYHAALIGHSPAYVDRLLNGTGFDVIERFGVGLSDKVVGAAPSLAAVVRPSVALARLAGSLHIAPAEFLVTRKR